MHGADLFPDEPDFTSRPAWQVIEAARGRHLTGELTLHTAPTTRIFLRDGIVYFAERTTDGALPIRLMMEGVITREQMQRGTVIVNGVEHVGRMFDADPTIDRPSVELCVELFTDDVLVDVANKTALGYEMVLYRRHSSGIDRWYPHIVPVVSRPNEVPAPQSQDVTESETSPSDEPKNKLDGPPITAAVQVTSPVPVIAPPPPPTVTQPVPTTASAPPQVPAAPQPTEVDASSIADEVAEAIKRAFAGMG